MLSRAETSLELQARARYTSANSRTATLFFLFSFSFSSLAPPLLPHLSPPVPPPGRRRAGRRPFPGSDRRGSVEAVPLSRRSRSDCRSHVSFGCSPRTSPRGACSVGTAASSRAPSCRRTRPCFSSTTESPGRRYTLVETQEVGSGTSEELLQSWRALQEHATGPLPIRMLGSVFVLL